MIIKYKKKKIEIPVKKVFSVGKITGLMFRGKNTDNLLFEFNKETGMKIHSFFVFFDFLAVWLDKKNNVLDLRIIKPSSPSIKSGEKFFKLVEIPVNEKNRKIINFFVGVRKI